MNNIIKRVWNQNRLVNIEDLSGMAFQQEAGGHTFVITGTSDEGPVELSGAVSASFIRPDGVEVVLLGETSDGQASVTLTDECYEVPGRFGLTVFLTTDNTCAIYAGVGSVVGTTGTAISGGTEETIADLIQAIDDAIGQIPADYSAVMGAIAAPYSSSSLYAVGAYAWYDGALYRCIVPITAGEAWTAGHWTQAIPGEINDRIDNITAYKIDSEPQLTTETGFISRYGNLESGSFHASVTVVKGDIYRIKGMTGANVYLYVLVADGAVVDYFQQRDEWKTKHDYDVLYKVPENGTLYINSIESWYIGIQKLDLVCACQPSVDENAKAVSDALQLNESVNLFDPSRYQLGYRQGIYVVSDDSYAYSDPIFLRAGTYLYTSTDSMFGNNDKVFKVDKFGVPQGNITADVSFAADIIGTVTEYGKYAARNVKRFTVDSDMYVSINLGDVSSPTKTQPQIDNFMLVRGSALSDFPKYEQGFTPYYTVKDSTVNGLSGLRGKHAIFDGDSICQGTTVGESDPTYGFGWAGRIGKANAMNWLNCGVGGGVITSASNPALSGRHSVVDNVDVIFASYPEVDYYIFEGGTNDADLLGNAIQDPTVLGTFDPMDFSGSYDPTTFSGAFETIIYKAINHWAPNRIGYIIPQKMGDTNGYSASVSNRRVYFERGIAICQKWGIPYIDLWTGCYLNPKNPLCRDSTLTPEQSIAQGYMYVDSQHLSAKGYALISPMIEAWMKTI